MGYDDVDYKAPCYRCGKILTGFQTKDGPGFFEKLKPSDVSNFYTGCDEWSGGCGAWNEYEVIIKDFEIRLNAEVVKAHEDYKKNQKKEQPR